MRRLILVCTVCSKSHERDARLYGLNTPKETICTKYESLFSGKNKKNILNCPLLEFLPSMLSVNYCCQYVEVRMPYIGTEDSEQLAHSRSLRRAFSGHFRINAHCKYIDEQGRPRSDCALRILVLVFADSICHEGPFPAIFATQVDTNWAATAVNVPSDKCARQRFRPACAFARFDQKLH